MREESGLGGALGLLVQIHPSYTGTGQFGPEPEFPRKNQGLSTADWLVPGSSWPCAPVSLDWWTTESPDSNSLVLCTWLDYTVHRGCASTRDLDIGVSIFRSFLLYCISAIITS